MFDIVNLIIPLILSSIVTLIHHARPFNTMPPSRDSLESRIPPSCTPDHRAILTAAWTHSLPTLKPLLDEPGKASTLEPTTRETPLHAAIRSLGPQPQPSSADANDDDAKKVEKAKEVVAELFQWGGIWNDIDNHNETPGCVALRLGRKDLYDMCVAAGMRAEMLFGILDGYEELGSDNEDDDEEDDDEEDVEMKDDTPAEATANGDETTKTKENGTTAGAPEETADEEMPLEDFEAALAAAAANANFTDPNPQENHIVTSDAYLTSTLTYDPKKLIDDAGNGVMMSWETEIMKRSVLAVLSPEPVPILTSSTTASTAAAPLSTTTTATGQNQTPTTVPPPSEAEIASLPPGKRILNVGFGMGIIDTLFAATRPSKHHIIEAHPSVLSYIQTSSDSKFGPSWEAQSTGAEGGGTEGGGAENGSTESGDKDNKVWPGRWQDIVPTLLAQGHVYDAIYFDTFGEDYRELKMFFTEYVPGLLDQDGRFGFFNGLGADRRICYDVYQRVVEMHLGDAGMEVEWQEVDVDMKEMGMEEECKGEWDGVVRRYWTLDKYQLPICTFLGY